MAEMRLSSIDFGSLLSYSPRGTSRDESLSRNFRKALKGDEYVADPLNQPKLMSDVVAEWIEKEYTSLPFANYFTNKPILVPTPSSSLMKRDTLWVPQRLAKAMVNRGFGQSVVECLDRVTAVRKAATSLASDRPKAAEHYSTMAVQKELSEPNEILLIDDVVTRGATLLGAANKLADAFPNTKIRAFAAMRTISPPSTFHAIHDPCVGTINLSGTETFRRP
jgi:hypothetical protein